MNKSHAFLIALVPLLSATTNFSAFADTANVFNPTGIEYPVLPSSLTFGEFKTIKIDGVLMAPTMIFVMGNEPASLKWLAANQQYFTKHSAVGFLIKADHEGEIHEIRQKTGFDAIFLYPTVDDLIAQYPVTHYPLVIDTHRRLIRQ